MQTPSLRGKALHRAPLKMLLTGMLALLGACATSSANDGGPRYQNNYVEFQPKGLPTLMRWKLQALRDGLPRPPQTPTPTVDADLGFIETNARAGAAMIPAVTWIGHATVLAQLGGLNVLTDPIFSERASPLSYLGPKRAQAPGVPLDKLPHIDRRALGHLRVDRRIAR